MSTLSNRLSNRHIWVDINRYGMWVATITSTGRRLRRLLRQLFYTSSKIKTGQGLGDKVKDF